MDRVPLAFGSTDNVMFGAAENSNILNCADCLNALSVEGGMRWKGVCKGYRLAIGRVEAKQHVEHLTIAPKVLWRANAFFCGR